MKKATLKFGDMEFTRLYVTTSGEMAECCHRLLKSKAQRFGLDIETRHRKGFENFEPLKRGKRTIGPAPGLCPYMSDIRLLQVYDPESKISYVFDLLHIGEGWTWKTSGILRALLTERKFIAHTALFEIKHLTFNGFPDVYADCSMLLSCMVDRAERSPFEPAEEDDDDEPKAKKTGYSLAVVTKRLYGLRVSKLEQTSDWNKATLTKSQINYAALDAVLTYRIGRDMMKKVVLYKMQRAYKVLQEMQYVVADMEIEGIAIDRETHHTLIKKWKIEHERLSKLAARRLPGVNLRSSKQLNEWAKAKYPEKFWKNEENWPRTGKPKPGKVSLSFGKDKLIGVIDALDRKYKHEAKALTAILEYKKVDKLLSTYGETLERIVHPVTGRIHSSFIIGETRTGRLSSREPNLQNLPRDQTVRKLFRAPDGKYLLVADFNQVEIRAQAALSGDPVMTNAFQKGIDLHKYILKMCFGWKMSEITDDQRQMGKAINFGFAFGMGAPKFGKYALASYKVKVTDEAAVKAFNTYRNTYKRYNRYCYEQRERCERAGFVRTPLGRMRRLLDGEHYTRAVNTPVQGGAAEAIMQGMIYIRREKPASAKLVLTVHDEVALETVDQDPRTKHIVEDCMTRGFSYVFPHFTTHKLIDAHYGRDWCEAKKG